MLPLQRLALSTYKGITGGSVIEIGTFYMVLEGPARGEIYTWNGGYTSIESKEDGE